MEYPRLARQWRTHSVQPAESTSDLSAGVFPPSAHFFRSQLEQTESRDDLARRLRSDPESTEEIEASGNIGESVSPAEAEPCTVTRSDQAAVAARLAGGLSKTSGHRSLLEVTYPIELPRANRKPLEPLKIHIAADHDDPAELVELVVEQDAGRTSVAPEETLAGRYVIIEKVDHCGMGLVYKALDRRRQRAGMPVPWVALKFATTKCGDRTTTSSYLRQEFLKLSQVSHPNIVSVYDFDNDNGLDFIVMEWLEGQTLANLLLQITSKRIALGKAADIVRSIGSALAHAHDLGIVHGDVKASNIFLTENRSVKLLDFGSSASSRAIADVETERNWATRAYASCEVLRGDTPQPHDDVFSLGVTAYCLLSGERPFGDLDAVEAKEQGVVPPPLPEDAQECWPAVERALRFDARDRPANAGEFLLEFTDPPAKVAAAPAERNQLEHIAYGAVAIALIIAFVAWAAGSVGGAPTAEQTILDDADDAFEAGRLVGSGEDSAFALYSSVLEAAPDAPRALDGVERIAEHYLTLARDALAADDPEAAAANLALARDVMPEHYGIAITSDLIARYGKDLLVNARQLAESDLEQAEVLLARASAFLPAGDPALEQVQADLARYRREAKLDVLLRGIDARILAERLTIPQGDSAIDLLRQARELAPNDREVILAADRIATALLFQSMFAISSGKLDDAQRFIDAAKALDVKHLALARAQYELAKARHEAVRNQSSTGG